MTTAAARGASKAVNEPVPVPISSTTSSGPERGRLQQHLLQVHVDEEVLAEFDLRPDARFTKPPQQEGECLLGRGLGGFVLILHGV